MRREMINQFKLALIRQNDAKKMLNDFLLAIFENEETHKPFLEGQFPQVNYLYPEIFFDKNLCYYAFLEANFAAILEVLKEHFKLDEKPIEDFREISDKMINRYVHKNRHLMPDLKISSYTTTLGLATGLFSMRIFRLSCKTMGKNLLENNGFLKMKQSALFRLKIDRLKMGVLGFNYAEHLVYFITIFSLANRLISSFDHYLAPPFRILISFFLSQFLTQAFTESSSQDAIDMQGIVIFFSSLFLLRQMNFTPENFVQDTADSMINSICRAGRSLSIVKSGEKDKESYKKITHGLFLPTREAPLGEQLSHSP